MTDAKPRQIAVPLTEKETTRLNRYLESGGIKKGAFVRLAILAYLDEAEGRNGKDSDPRN